jgi:hypothetical protein
VTDSLAAAINIPDVEVYDEVSIVENLVNNLAIPDIEVFDSVIAGDYISILIESFVLAVDTVTVAEDLSLEHHIAVSAYDSVVISDVLYVENILGSISVYDQVVVLETAEMYIYYIEDINISVFDTVTITDYLYRNVVYAAFVGPITIDAELVQMSVAASLEQMDIDSSLIQMGA